MSTIHFCCYKTHMKYKQIKLDEGGGKDVIPHTFFWLTVYQQNISDQT